MSDYASQLPVRTENNGDVVSKIVDYTVPSQGLGIDSSGRVTMKLSDSGGNLVTTQANGAQRALDVGINVLGVQIDPRAIRALTSADVVTANQGTANTAANGWFVKITDGTNTAGVLATGEVKVSITQPLPAGTNNIGKVDAWVFSGGGNSIESQALGGNDYLNVVTPGNGSPGSGAPAYATQMGGTDGTNLRAISTDTAGRVNVDLHDATGNAFTTGNPLPVQISTASPGTDLLDYKTAVALAAAASDTHTYTVPALTTTSLQMIAASGSGKIRMEVQIASVTKIVMFNSTANPNIQYPFYAAHDIPAGTVLDIIITNLDKQAQDVYSTIEGVEF